MSHDRDELIKEMAREVAALNGHSDDWDRFLDEARDYLAAAERALAEKHARIADGHRAYNDSHYDRIRNGVCDEISAKIRASIGGENE